MQKKVVKFGGAALADAAQFERARSLIEADPGRLFVVVAAPGKRSYRDADIEGLLEECYLLAAQERPLGEPFEAIADRFVGIAGELRTRLDIHRELDGIWANITGGEPLDFVRSRGAYLSALLMAECVGFRFVDAAPLILVQEGGEVDMANTQQRMEQAVATASHIVLPGGYGAAPGGDIRMFERGGADLTGALLARGVCADLYECWADVPGMLSADPRIVNNPAPIRRLTYLEYRELSYMRDQGLDGSALYPVRQACIPVYLRDLHAQGEEGSMILPESELESKEGTITGVAGKRGFTAIEIKKDGLHEEVGLANRALAVLNDMGVALAHMPTGIDSFTIVLEDGEIEGRRDELVDNLLLACDADSVETYDGLALIAVVGRGLVNAAGACAILFTALAVEEINVRVLSQSIGQQSVIVGVQSDDMERAIRAIYAAFLESDRLS